MSLSFENFMCFDHIHPFFTLPRLTLTSYPHNFYPFLSLRIKSCGIQFVLADFSWAQGLPWNVADKPSVIPQGGG